VRAIRSCVWFNYFTKLHPLLESNHKPLFSFCTQSMKRITWLTIAQTPNAGWLPLVTLQFRPKFNCQLLYLYRKVNSIMVDYLSFWRKRTELTRVWIATDCNTQSPEGKAHCTRSCWPLSFSVYWDWVSGKTGEARLKQTHTKIASQLHERNRKRKNKNQIR